MTTRFSEKTNFEIVGLIPKTINLYLDYPIDINIKGKAGNLYIHHE